MLVKTLFYGSWSCAITAAALTIGLQFNGGEDTKADMPKVEKPSTFTGPHTLIAPILSDGSVSGFMFASVTAELAPGAAKTFSAPVEAMFQDAYNSMLIGNRDYELPKRKTLDFVQFKADLLASINKSAGDGTVLSLRVGALNFIAADEVRTKQGLRSVWLQDRQAETPIQPEAETEKAASH